MSFKGKVIIIDDIEISLHSKIKRQFGSCHAMKYYKKREVKLNEKVFDNLKLRHKKS